jgi:hypothetical protein
MIRVTLSDRGAVREVEFDNHNDGRFRKATSKALVKSLVKRPKLKKKICIQLATPGGNGGPGCVMVGLRMVCP